MVLAGSLLVSCSVSPSPESAACADAAAAQAFAETEFGEAVEQSQAAHADPATAEQDHQRFHGLVVSARIDVILAEAATRRHCG